MVKQLGFGLGHEVKESTSKGMETRMETCEGGSDVASIIELEHLRKINHYRVGNVRGDGSGDKERGGEGSIRGKVVTEDIKGDITGE